MRNDEFVGKALDYIRSAWQDETLTLEKIAEKAGFSVSYFDRMFAGATGKSVMEYVREFKLIHSAVILRTSDASILDIALEHGYENPENYARAFKARYGMPPSAYREANKTVPLHWKDSSTGTVIKRFEEAFPALERVRIEDFLDVLYLQDPVRYVFHLYFAQKIDCAAYRLSDAEEYMLVEEYRAHVVSLTLFCKPENIHRYIRMAKAFPTYCILVPCETDYVIPEDKFGFAHDREYVQYSFAYLEPCIETPVLPGYTVRELEANDRAAVERMQQDVTLPTNNTTAQDRYPIDTAASLRMGYTCISKQYAYTNEP